MIANGSAGCGRPVGFHRTRSRKNVPTGLPQRVCSPVVALRVRTARAHSSCRAVLLDRGHCEPFRFAPDAKRGFARKAIEENGSQLVAVAEIMRKTNENEYK